MIDPDIYDRYSIPMEKQMQKIAKRGLGLGIAVKKAEIIGFDAEFVHDASRLINELSGSPGDGALEIYRDLNQNVESAKRFVERWESETTSYYSSVLKEASSIRDELVYFQNLVNDTPPEVMNQIKTNIRTVRALKGKCFIATAVYGDENAPEVQVLRTFRDDVLMESYIGKKVVDFYYSGFGRKTADIIKSYAPFIIPSVRKGLDQIAHRQK